MLVLILHFVRAIKDGALDLRRRVAQLFTINDDENSALAYVLDSAALCTY
jgi:hypothetical protein